MYDNKSAIELATRFIELCPVREGGYPLNEIIPVVDWIKSREDYEREFGVGTLGEQLEWFSFLLGIGRDEIFGGIQSLGNFMLTGWAARTANLYGVAYHEGHTDGHLTGVYFTRKREARTAERTVKTAKMKAVRHAAKGRRLIGAASRAKVAKAAESFMHLSKNKASYEMASLVNLDPGTVKRYLSEIFPGDKWKK